MGTGKGSDGFFTQLHVPIREVDEVFPTVVTVHPKIDLDEGAPFRALWFAHKQQACLPRGAVGLSCIATDAGADDVLPCGGSSMIARDHVIEIELVAVENHSAILARVLVTLKNVVTRELDFLLWHSIKNEQKNDPRNANSE